MLSLIDMKKALFIYILSCFLMTGIIGPMPAYAQEEFRLPAPGVMVDLSPPFDPPILKGIKVHPDNPLRFEFILDRGDSQLSNNALKNESSKLIKYFLASLTIPEKDLWVNLSPYEKDKIIPRSFGLTEMGRNLLAEDYMLKQITASLIYPENEIGKKFWKRIYEAAEQKFGTTNIPVNTFNKVWIVPESAVVYENAKAGTAYVVESKLKVMLEQDYLSLRKHIAVPNSMASVGANIVREIVIPELNREVNEDKNFAQLRQAYSSLILASWYKKKIKDSLLEQIYADKNKINGTEYTQSILNAGRPGDMRSGPNDVEIIYQRYLQAFKKGVYNYIKEEQDPMTMEMIPKKYFSGGLVITPQRIDYAMSTDARLLKAFSSPADRAVVVEVNVSPQAPEDHSDKAMLREYVKDTLAMAKAENQIPVLNYTFEPERSLITVILGEENKRYFDVTPETLPTVIRGDGRWDRNTIFIGPSNLELTPQQEEKFLEIIGFQIPEQERDLFKTIGTIARLQRKILQELVKEHTDDLTGMLNWKAIPGVFRQIIGRIPENGRIHLRLANVDLDSLKAVSSIWGQDKARKVVEAVADAVKESIRGEDVAFHLHGGDEYAILMPMLDEPRNYPETIRKAIRDKVYSSLGFSGEQVIEALSRPFAKSVEPVVYEGLLYQIALQHRNLKKTDIAKIRARFKTLKLLVKELRNNPQSPYNIDGWYLTPSMGVVNFDERKTSDFNEKKAWEGLLKQSNTYLDMAKLEGKDRMKQGPSKDLAMRVMPRTMPSVVADRDSAMTRGGIDLSPANNVLKTQNNGGEIKFHMDPAMLKQLQNAPGFIPVIISIQPMTDLRQFLGAP
jgi:diguanylate cyclase (GGDEF)-like protein